MERVIKMIKNIWFYIGFVGFLSIIMRTTKSQVLSFDRFPAQLVLENTTLGDISYIRKKNIGEFAVGISYANITYGIHRPVYFDGKIALNDIDTMLFLVEQMEKASQTNIQALIENSSNKTLLLSSYIKKHNTIVKQATSLRPSIAIYIRNLQTDMYAYENEQKIADDNYTLGMRIDNPSVAKAGYKRSEEISATLSSIVSQIDQYMYVIQGIDRHLGLLERQAKFLDQNMDIFIEDTTLLYQFGTSEEIYQLQERIIKNT